MHHPIHLRLGKRKLAGVTDRLWLLLLVGAALAAAAREVTGAAVQPGLESALQALSREENLRLLENVARSAAIQHYAQAMGRGRGQGMAEKLAAIAGLPREGSSGQPAGTDADPGAAGG